MTPTKSVPYVEQTSPSESGVKRARGEGSVASVSFAGEEISEEEHAIMKGGPELSQGVREIVLALYAKIER